MRDCENPISEIALNKMGFFYNHENHCWEHKELNIQICQTNSLSLLDILVEYRENIRHAINNFIEEQL